MCRNTILRFVLGYFYLYTQVIVMANMSGFKKKITFSNYICGRNVEKECNVWNLLLYKSFIVIIYVPMHLESMNEENVHAFKRVKEENTA